MTSADKEIKLLVNLIGQNPFDWEYLLDEKGNLLSVSEGIHKITGYNKNDFLYNPNLINDIVHPDSKSECLSHTKSELNSACNYDLRFYIKNKNGEKQLILHHCFPVFDDKGVFIGRRAINRNIATADSNSSLILSKVKKAEILSEIIDRISSDENVDLLVDELFSSLSSFFINCRLIFAHITQGQMDVVKSIQPDGMPDLKNLKFDLNNYPDYLKRIESEKIIISKDVRSSDSFKNLTDVFDKIGTRALIDVPLKIDNELKGLFCIDSDIPRDWSDEETVIMLEIAQFLSMAIEKNKRLTSLKNINEKVEQTLKRFITLIDSLQGGILVEDENRDILYINELFLNLFNIPVPKEILIGTNCAQAADQSKHLMMYPEPFVARINELLDNREEVLNDIVEMADGRILERDYIPIFLEKNYLGHFWHYRDITEKFLANKNLIEINNQLIISQKLLREEIANKNKFFSIIAHDLKSPFTVLLGYAEYLAAEFPKINPDDAHEYIKSTYSTAKRTFALVDDLLEWSRIKIGTFNISTENILLIKIFGKVLNELRESIQLKNLRVELDINPLEIVIFDKYSLETILKNIISNSIKFSHAGRTITIGHTVKNGILNLFISDNGIGMSEAVLNSLFKIETHNLGRGTEGEKGTGLGLIICQELMKLNNGELSVESAEGSGTTVTLTIQRFE